jgi:hypothetical protein
MYRFRKPLLIVFICLSAINFYSCKPKPKEILTAEFTLTKRFFKTGDSVKFSNKSKSFKTVTWDFGDGTSSSEINPVHVYNKSGKFNPKIRVSDGKNPIEFSLSVNISASNVTIVIPDTITAGKEALFRTSGAGKFNWKIDNEVKAENSESLKFTFPKDGSHKIEIINPATASSVDTKDISVLVVTAKNVVAEPKKTAVIVIPASANTGDMVDYSTTYKDPVEWDFGKEKSVTSSGKISFPESGKYTVKLIDKASGTVLNTKTITIMDKFDDNKFSEWLTSLANVEMSRSQKTELSIKVYGYCQNDGDVPVSGSGENSSFKDFVRKLIIEANNYERITVVATANINPNTKKISSVQLSKYEKKSVNN